MTFTHEQLLDAVRKAGRDGQTFSCAAVREHLNLSTRDRRVLSRFHRQFRAFQEVAGDEIVKLGNNSYRLKTTLEPASVSVLETETPVLAAEQVVAEEAIAAAPAAETAAAEPVAAAPAAVQTAVSGEPVAAEPVLEAVPAAHSHDHDVADRQLELVIAESAAPEAVVTAEPAALGDVTSTAEASSMPSLDDVSSTSCDVEPMVASETELNAVREPEVAETAEASELASVSETAMQVVAESSELVTEARPSEQTEASAVDAPSSFFDEAPARFEPSLDSEVDLHELADSVRVRVRVPVETQPDARRSMLSLSEAAQLFDTPAPRQPRQVMESQSQSQSQSQSRVRSWVSSPLEHAQSLLSGSWRERGQRLGRRVAGLFNRA
jgi:hypothetical protein